MLNKYKLFEFETIDSTNEEAKRLIASGQVDFSFAVIWSKSQSKGRGRTGKQWLSPAGNLYVSLLMKIDYNVRTASQISFIAAHALGEVISPLLAAGYKLHYKWPNDVLIDGKKLAGILLESVVGAKEKNRLEWLIVGVGVNIEEIPKDLPIPATSLENCGITGVSAKDLLTKFVDSFNSERSIWENQGFSSVKAAWLDRAYKIGEPIKIKLGANEFSGIFHGINDGGDLELLVDGKTKLISSGEVFF